MTLETSFVHDLRILAVDQALDSVSVIVKYEYNRVQTQLQHIGEGLDSQVQAAFTRNENAALVSTILSDSFEDPDRSSGGVTDASEDRLVVHARAAGKLRSSKSKCGCACFANDEVAWFEELPEGLEICQLQLVC